MTLTCMTSETPSQRVAQSIRKRLRTQRISQGTVARRLNMSQQAVSRRLTGDVELTLSELLTVAELLDTTVDNLTTPAALATSDGGDAA